MPATPESSPAISVSMPAPDIALITLDLPASRANILNEQLFDELDQTLETLARRDDLIGVVLTSAKPSIFVAGADLNQIAAHLDWPDSEIIRFCQRGRAVMARLSRCPFVSIAAIHGACVGGGLELALWCDYRLATDHPRTQLGLPEVKLGLVPGWAGTARLPRIAGLEVALDLVTSGRLVSADQARQLKFVDEVVPPSELLDAAEAMVRRVHTSESFIQARREIMGPVPGFEPQSPEAAIAKLQPLLESVGASIVANREIYPYAPTVALEHMTRTASLGIKEAWDSESRAMAQVWGSPASRGLLNHFFLVDRNRKHPGLVDLTLETDPIDSVGIVGAGLMGQAIARSCLAAGIPVLLLDADDQAARKSLGILKDRFPESDVRVALDYSEFAAVDAVIESVVETRDVKSIVHRKIEAAVSPTTLIATNTSAIPIESLSGPDASSPERLCGIHFCHPDLMSLVEVVSGPKTSEATVTRAVRFVQRLRKMPVAINDSPGFVVNRLLAAMLDQCLRLVQQGLSIEPIDRALRDFGFLGGPFEMIDVIGVDTCMYAGRTMLESGLTCVSLSPILPRMVKLGRLGRKSGSGFYRYDQLDGDAQSDPQTESILKPYRLNREPTPEREDSEMVEPIMAAMALEATRILDEEIVADPRDIDLCVMHGFSFPQHQGGILFWADRVGWSTVRGSLLRIADLDPRWVPNDTVNRLADTGGSIYAAR